MKLKRGDIVLCTYGWNKVRGKPFEFLYEFGYYTDYGCVVYKKWERNLQDAFALKVKNVSMATEENIKNNYFY